MVHSKFQLNPLTIPGKKNFKDFNLNLYGPKIYKLVQNSFSVMKSNNLTISDTEFTVIFLDCTMLTDADIGL